MTPRQHIEKIADGVRQTIEEFKIDNNGVEPNCLFFGGGLADEVHVVMRKLGKAAAEEWMQDDPRFGQKTFLGLPVAVIHRGHHCGAGLVYPLGLFVRPASYFKTGGQEG